MGILVATRRKHMKKLLKHPAAKAAGLLLGTAVLALGVTGIDRYSAFASEVLPNFPIPKSVFAKSDENDQRYHFSMEVVGNRASRSAVAAYKVFEMDLTSQSGETVAMLRLQGREEGDDLKTYQKSVSDEQFVRLWRLLRELDAEQLTDLSPYTERLGEAEATKRVSGAATYRFKFQDGLYDYPNSFEVYAPEHLEDDRYDALARLAMTFTVEVFDLPFVE